MANRIVGLTLLIMCVTLSPVAGGHAAAPEAVKLYTVNSPEDYQDVNLGNGICDTGGNVCTLRAAIQEANRDGMPSTIKFSTMMEINYPTLEGLVEPFTVIDGSDQWDSVFGRPGVKIGAGGYTDGILFIQGNAAGVDGIECGGGGSTGIVVSASQNTIIGGTEPGQRNVFLMTDHATLDAIGIEITNSAINTDVRGNYFGTWDGTSAIVGVGEYGLFLRSGGNTVRENLIVGHSEAGIFCWSLSGNAYVDNIIGTDKYKSSALPNKVGIHIESSDGNQIGPYNYIAGNTQEGIVIRHSDNNYVLGNEVGDSSLPNGGDGIYMLDGNDNFLGFAVMNKVENNGGYGLAMYYSDNNHIQNNSFHANTKAGIYLKDSEDNDIGGTLPYGRNVMSENGTYGVHLSTGADNNTVSGNHIGFGWTGAFDHGNLSHGVLIAGGASDNRIGGLEPGRGNWIGWNDGSAIYIEGSGTSGNVVEGNIIGAPINWAWEAPNGNHGIGIYDGASGNWIGWNNTIVSSGWSGVVIVNASFNVVWYNHIGTDGADVTWGNSYYGVHVVNSPGNQIIGNNIAYNGTNAGEPGVRVEGSGSTNNFISVNSIHDNGGLGIELFDAGNSNQPAPTVTAGGCATAISGTACTGCLVEIFSDAAEEGWHYEGSANADATTGAFSWSGTPAGPKITATASSSLLGATSEFSAPHDLGMTCNGVPTASFTFTPSNPSRCVSVTFDASGSHDPEDPGSALQVRWDWNNDGTYETAWDTQKTASHTFMTTAVHTVRLQLMDSGGLMDATTRQVSVSGVECEFVFLPLIMRNLK
jgi:CSLREA domain-containing protein